MRMKLFSCVLFLLLVAPISHEASAWDQGTHRQINYEAVNVFYRQMEGKKKYLLGPLPDELRKEPYRGIAVTSSGLDVGHYRIVAGSFTMPQWIVVGGDWADEPHLYASVRHFYDPLGLVKPYLTDQFWAHGVLYEAPGIDAKTWGLEHPDNPFSFRQGLTYYKLAMEVAENVPLPRMLAPTHFKLNLDLAPTNHAEQRRIYLALAYRSLGEAMHMMGDMTQPAHVRNDSHPLDEPIETRTFSEHVRAAAADPFLDPRLTPFLASAGGTLQEPERLFREVAGFTNKHFYSEDTIHDKASGIIPNNYDPLLAHAYPAPQFSDLRESATSVQGYLIKRRVKRYEGQGGAFDWTTVPMAQERLSFHWFDPDQSIWIDPLESAAAYSGATGRYHIPNAYAPKQAKVLLPIAIHANADLMDMFFPTMELVCAFAEKGVQKGDAPGGEEYSRHVIQVDTAMTHHQEQDVAWKAYALKIEYTGPATLVISRDAKPVTKRALHFRKGKLEAIEKADGTLEKKELRLYAPLGEHALIEEEEFYHIEDGQTVHVEIEAGTRRFKSEPWTYKEEEKTVTILPPRIVTYEMAEGASEVTHEFEAAARPDDAYRYVWDFGDGTTFSEAVQPGGTSKTSHTYANLKAGTRFHPQVKLESASGAPLAKDSISIDITEKEDAAPTPAADKGEGRWMLTRTWQDILEETRFNTVKVQGGETSATINIVVSDKSATWTFDYAASWSPLPVSAAPREEVDIRLSIDKAQGPSPWPVWSCGLEINDGRYKGNNYPPLKAAFLANMHKWHSIWIGHQDKATKASETTYTISFGNDPKKGEKQVVTIRFVGHGCGAGIAHGAIHQFYEYTYQP
ncbi:hypothetical protein Dbac_2526 [Desulfomicrobium baculatum DSM 4028]|uniref:PKD domain-containing protein n=2 Tax=Desulfomicrobium baculatum TaxID=899 RepID=C7LS57_DESBD|nr:hypothetical protein Dbac_2526 [Desulfomicrobium baculatum DSM 4028]